MGNWDVVDDQGNLTHKMCCICFGLIPVEELWRDSDGQKWDMCVADGEAERECTCAMTESSFRACAKHGEKAPPY